MKIYDQLAEMKTGGKKGIFILIDPDKGGAGELAKRALAAQEAGITAVLVGGSLLSKESFDVTVRILKESLDIPIIIFPGGSAQVSKDADAIFFLSLISGRNPQYLISEHVTAAPGVKKIGLEAVPVGYMLIESGSVTAVEYVSNTKPIPRNQVGIAVAHALAGEMLGMKMIYLEAGSGADKPVPAEMIAAVSRSIDIPLIVGGGIRNGDDAKKAVEAGADFIVIGNAFEDNDSGKFFREIASVV